MYFAYVDESGNSGWNGSRTFTLGCLLVEAERWPDIFDDVLDFRRSLRDKFRLPVRAEIKANFLIRNGGPLRPLALSESARFSIYRSHMRLVPKLGCHAFAIVIDKNKMKATNKTSTDPRDVAWEFLLQRLERFTTKGKTFISLIHDEGHEDRVRALARKARRAGTAGSAFGSGSLKRPARRLLDDPVPKKSHESYFLQFGDLIAYAAFRKIVPPGINVAKVVPQTMWDELGDGAYAKANAMSGGPPGIVTWP